MYLKIIENYINKLSKDDIILFAFKNNIILKPNIISAHPLQREGILQDAEWSVAAVENSRNIRT